MNNNLLHINAKNLFKKNPSPLKPNEQSPTKLKGSSNDTNQHEFSPNHFSYFSDQGSLLDESSFLNMTLESIKHVPRPIPVVTFSIEQHEILKKEDYVVS